MVQADVHTSRHKSSNQAAWWMEAALPPSCVALSQRLSLSELQCPNLRGSHEDTYLTGWL